MCGRFTLTASTEKLAGLFDIDPASMPPVEPRYNIAPTQPVAAVRQDEEGERELALLRWGLVPFWAKDLSIGSRMINQVSEQILKQFGENFTARVQALAESGAPQADAPGAAAAPPPEPTSLNALALVWDIVRGWFARLFGRDRNE